ncbi:MAG: UDP-glucose 4-epimerase [Nitrosomonadaceae bacterium]|nr:UDP-glucose 4-epimerase [Nitrosomonadaceae bacterium]
MSLKIVVTGAAGFIGSHTVDHLLQVGNIVLGVDNFRTGIRSNLVPALGNARFTLCEIDVLDEPAFSEIVANFRPDAIIHLAALVSVPESIANPTLNHRLNFQSTEAVAEAARLHRVPRIVFASSAAVYGDPTYTPISENGPTQPLSCGDPPKTRPLVMLV